MGQTPLYVLFFLPSLHLNIFLVWRNWYLPNTISLTSRLMVGKGHLLNKVLYICQICPKIWLCLHSKSSWFTQDFFEMLQKVQSYWMRPGWITGTVGHHMWLATIWCSPRSLVYQTNEGGNPRSAYLPTQRGGGCMATIHTLWLDSTVVCHNWWMEGWMLVH